MAVISPSLSIRRFLESLTLDNLRQLLEKEQLAKSGLKADIIERIIRNVPPQRILLNLHDDDVIKFAEHHNYTRSDGALTIAPDERCNRQHGKQGPKERVRQSSSRSVVTNSDTPAYRSRNIHTARDLANYRELANQCRGWILENVWNDITSVEHGKLASSVSENMEDVVDTQIDRFPMNDDIQSVFHVEELLSDSSVEPPTTATGSLVRPLIAAAPDGAVGEGEDHNTRSYIIGKSRAKQKKELEGIKRIILATFFTRLKHSRHLLQQYSSTMEIHLLAMYLASCACIENDGTRDVLKSDGASSSSTMSRSINETMVTSTTTPGHQNIPIGLVTASKDLACLFWQTVESFISIRRLNQEASDSGRHDVCVRLIELCQVLDFEPNFDTSTIREDDRGTIRVECQGVYYHEGQPIGPFELYIALIRNMKPWIHPGSQFPQPSSLSDTASIQIATESTVDPDYWCVRALVLKCL